MSYIFGGDTGLSYEQVKRKRELAERLAANRSKAPTTFGGGLSAIGEALMYRKLDKDARKGEQEGRERADSAFQAILGGNALGGGYTPSQGSTAAPSYVPEVNVDQGDPRRGMFATGSSEERPEDMAGRIRSGLVQRGMPEHVADAFVMNFQDESGLNPGINERNPIVPGARGGFGLAQWTGPRRRQLEAFAQQQGKPVSDPDVQMDFLMTELQGSERRAAESIFNAQDTGTAAAAIVNDFLRPAEEHRARRAQRYMGQGGQGVQVAQSGPGVEQVMAAMSNPWMSQEQKSALGLLLQQRMQQNDPMRLLQMQNLQSQIDERGRPDPRYRQVSGADLGMSGPDAQRMYNVGPDGKVSAIGGGGTNVSVHNTGPEPGRYLYADDAGLPKGWRFDTQTQQAERIPGGPDAVEAEDTEAKKAERARQEQIKMGTTLTNLQMNIDEIQNGGMPVTGPIGAMAGMVPGTAASDWRTRNAQITTDAALAEVQNMRDNSPTGGAVGQLTDSEREAIAVAASGISDAQSAEEYVRAAQNYRQVMLDTAFGAGKWRLDDKGSLSFGEPTPAAQPTQAAPMTFEQFSQDPSAQAAARQYGVTVEEMWEIKQGLGR